MLLAGAKDYGTAYDPPTTESSTKARNRSAPCRALNRLAQVARPTAARRAVLPAGCGEPLRRPHVPRFQGVVSLDRWGEDGAVLLASGSECRTVQTTRDDDQIAALAIR